jgi:hypothetical protein
MQIEQDDKFVHDRFGKVVVSSVVEVYRSYDPEQSNEPYSVVVRFKDCDAEWNTRASPPFNRAFDQFVSNAQKV